MVEKLKNFFIPKFTELDAAILTFALLMPIFESRDNLWIFYSNLSEDTDHGRALLFMAILLYWVYIVIKSILTKNNLSYHNIKYLARFYFFILSALSLFYAAEILFQPAGVFNTYIDYINLFFIYVLLIRSIISLGISSSKSDEMQNMLAERFQNYQTSIIDTLIALFCVFVIYFLLRGSSTILASMLLAYFYTEGLVGIKQSFSSVSE